MKPFAHNTDLSEQQRNYNYRICKARIVTEIAFGRLKARWRWLLKRNEMLVENIPNVITAACVLHNICEIHHDHFNDSCYKTLMSMPSISSIAKQGHSHWACPRH